MKDIIVIYEYGSIISGAAKVAIESAIALSKKGYNVTYFCSVGPIDIKLKKNIQNVICLNQYDILNNPSRLEAIKQGIWNSKAYNAVRELLNNTDPTKVTVIIHGYSHTLSSSVVKACNDFGIKPYIVLHEYFSVCPNGGFYNYQKNQACLLKPMTLKCIACNCDVRSFFHKGYRVLRQFVQDKFIRNNKNIKMIYLSEFSIEKMRKYLTTNDFYYLHNPVEPYDSEKVDASLNDTFLFIGRISPEKGVDLFCEAIEKLGLKGVVIGDGSRLKELKETYKTINFVGWKNKEEIALYIKKARCLVFPSLWYEVSPLTTEECLIQGIPCIVPDICAAKDQIVNGINGLVFKTGSVVDLIDKIKIVSEDKLLFNYDKWPRYAFDFDSYIDNLERIIYIKREVD